MKNNYHVILSLHTTDVGCYIDLFTEPKEALEFLEKIKDKVKGSDEAAILCLTISGNIRLKQKEMDRTKVATTGPCPMQYLIDSRFETSL